VDCNILGKKKTETRLVQRVNLLLKVLLRLKKRKKKIDHENKVEFDQTEVSKLSRTSKTVMVLGNFILLDSVSLLQ